MVISKTEKAYIAGLMDGEGSFTIDKTICKQLYTYIRGSIHIGLCDKITMEWLQNKIKFGKIRVIKQSGRKDFYIMTTSNPKKIEPFLIQIFPYLRIKRKRGELLLDFLKNKIKKEHKRDNKTGKFLPMTISINPIELEYYKKMKELNKRGKPK